MGAFLIDTEVIKELGFTNGNVEDNIIATTIRRVQDTMLEPVIGTSFYRRLLQGVEDDDLNADETALMNDYITPLLVAAVDLRIIDHLTYEIRSKTVGTSRDEYMNPVTESENNRLADQLRKDYVVYKNKLIGHLRENEDNFPEYRDYVCNEEFQKPENKRQQVSVRFR